MSKHRILVVEDDHKTTELIRLYLVREDFQVLVAYDGRYALEVFRAQHPDLIILDLMLPEIDGLDVCRIVRAESDIPIIMLTARTTEEDKLKGLNLGADDYIVKPFSPLELMARVRAVLRRAGKGVEEVPTVLTLGDLTVDPTRHEVRLNDAIVNLTPKEFRLLSVLARAPGRAFSRADLLEEAFGLDYEGLERTIDVHIMNIRRKIETDPAQPHYIMTVYGVGYKMCEEDVFA